MTAKHGIAAGAAAATLLLALTGASRPAQAYSLEGPTWAGRTTTIDYAVAGQPNTTFSSALRQALVIWNAKSAFKWSMAYRVANPCASSGPVGAALRTTDCGRAFGSGVLGITTYWYDGANHFIHAGTVFNANANFSIYDGPLQRRPDFRRVAIHEMGHALGLGHENNSSIPAIMQPFTSDTDRPTWDDIRGIRAMYGAP